MSHHKLYGAQEDDKVNKLGFATNVPFAGRSSNQSYGERAFDADRPKPFVPSETHLNNLPFTGESETRAHYTDMSRSVERGVQRVPPTNLEVPRDSRFEGHTASEDIGVHTNVSPDRTPARAKKVRRPKFETESMMSYNDRSQQVDRPSPIIHDASLRPEGGTFEGTTESRRSYTAHQGVVRPPAFKPPSEQAELSIGHKFYGQTESRDAFVGRRANREQPAISKYQDSGDILGHPDSDSDEAVNYTSGAGTMTRRTDKSVGYHDEHTVHEYSAPGTPQTPTQYQQPPPPHHEQQQQQQYQQHPGAPSPAHSRQSSGRGSQQPVSTGRLEQIANNYDAQSSLPSSARTEPPPSADQRRLY